jgi:electron transport complex protein RnfC
MRRFDFWVFSGRSDPVSGRRLYPIDGGIAFADYHKRESNATPIVPAPLASHYVVPLRTTARTSAKPIVTVGTRVRKGELLGVGEGPLGVAVHAPTSGWIRALEPFPLPHPSGLTSLSYLLEPDGADEPSEPTPFGGDPEDRSAVSTFLEQMGLVGLGGAAFPTHAKVTQPVTTLILNGAECEPWITCDDRLMRERANEIIAGARLLATAVAAREVLVAIEDNKPEAIAAMRTAAAQESAITIVAIPTRYPAGGEKQLIQRLTGREVPYGRLPAEFGLVVVNVGTARAVYRAMVLGEPLIERVVTLTGAAAHCGNRWVRIGHPIAELVELMEPAPEVDRYLLGGPMTGFALTDLDVPLLKGSNCLIAASPALFPPPEPEQPCIRCGACAPVCPARLEPMALYWFAHADQFDKARAYHLFDCIECSCCAYVCPAHIPLVDYFRYAKSEVAAREAEQRKAQQSRERFTFRTYRLEREKAEKAARAAAKAAETRQRLAQAEEATCRDVPQQESEEERKKALVEAALAKAKARRAAASSQESLSVDAPKALPSIGTKV